MKKEMDGLLLISIFVSMVLNIFLFFFLYNKKRNTNDAFLQKRASLEESEVLEKVLEAEIHKVERYDEYSFSLVTVLLDKCPDSLLSELRSFVRKSDSVYLFNDMFYLIFPFLRLESTFIKKINEDMVAFIRAKHPDIEILKVEVQECNIHEVLKLDDVLKKEMNES
jgi:hypothetical protein